MNLQKRILITFIIIIILGIVIYLSSLQKDKDEPNSLESHSLEYKLASIDKGYEVLEDDITIARFRSLLNQLDDKFVEDRQQIADMSVKTQELLRDKGISESLLNIMEGINSILVTELESQKYAEYAGTYVTLRDSGMSHQEVIDGFNAMLESLD